MKWLHHGVALCFCACACNNGGATSLLLSWETGVMSQICGRDVNLAVRWPLLDSAYFAFVWLLCRSLIWRPWVVHVFCCSPCPMRARKTWAQWKPDWKAGKYGGFSLSMFSLTRRRMKTLRVPYSLSRRRLACIFSSAQTDFLIC